MIDPSNPWFAMAMQGAQNLGNLRMGQPTVSPLMAYQQQVMNNARLQQQQTQQRLSDLQLQKAERDLDPFANYRLALEQNLVSPDMTLAEFQQMGNSASKRPVRTFVGENGNMWYISGTGTAVDTGQKASPPGEKIVTVGGVPYVEQTLPGGEVQTLPLDQYAQQYRTQQRESEAGATAAGKSWGGYDAAFEQNIPGSIQSLSKTIEFVRNLRDDIQTTIDTGDDVTGPIEGRWTPYVDRAAAYLNTMSTLLTIPALKEAKLQPVTEQELNTIRETFASVLRDPEANIGALTAQLEWLEPRLQELQNQLAHYQQYGTMRGYGGTRDADVDTSLGDDDLGDIPD